MNYITLNGVKSSTIKGLLVQSLPPITKPLVRTRVEEIDGRDGDVVTRLGYSAYDKEILIGLHGEFDINDVIAFFASEGIVTFSSEPDKYYYYQINEQINFERLIRYRTATVTIHVQPFKYSLTEQTYVKIYTNSEETDTFIVTNQGNTTAKPTITVYGSGDIDISLNGVQVFAIALSNEQYITIDTARLEAYTGDTLKNRLVTGDYENFVLNVGRNTLTWAGSVTEITVDNYSRWI